jgi:NADH dehydrogenase
VSVRTGVRITQAAAHALVTAEGERIEADLMVWAAGVRGPAMLDGLDLEVNRNRQLVVRDTLQTTRDERIFAIGDCCCYVPPGATSPVPPRAQAAHQMAATAFDNLTRLMAGKPLKRFVYRDHGSLVSLSRFSTVGSLMGSLIGGKMAIEGRLARLVYTSLYRIHLIAIHGWLKGMALLLVGRVNRIIRPRLKLH